MVFGLLKELFQIEPRKLVLQVHTYMAYELFFDNNIIYSIIVFEYVSNLIISDS